MPSDGTTDYTKLMNIGEEWTSQLWFFQVVVLIIGLTSWLKVQSWAEHMDMKEDTLKGRLWGWRRYVNTRWDIIS